MQICKKNECTGCGACYNVCPKKCIELKEDEEGVIRPDINEEKCIHCNICVKTCPENNKIEFYTPTKVYAAWSLDDDIRKQSSSGGIAYEIYKYIVSNGGLAVGTKFNENMILEHTIANNLEEIQSFKGSKYVQSSIGDIYNKIKQNLKLNKKVVFVGTPCQVSGLKSFVKNIDTKNLITIDLVCHGVPPIKYFKDYLKYLEIDLNIDNVSFRGINNWNFTAYKNNDIIYKKHNKEDLYYKSFLKGLFYRPNCYQCKYARRERIADITLGDFWGIGKNIEFNYDIKDGVSLILVNTAKGNDLIEEIKSKLFIEERTIEEACLENKQLNYPSPKHEKTDEYKKLYKENGFKVAIEKTIK